MTSRKKFGEAHEGYEFRQFKCSGSCGTIIEALAHSQLWCNQPGYRGSMKPSYPVSAKRLANDQFEAAQRRNETRLSTPVFWRLSPRRRPSSYLVNQSGLEVPIRASISGQQEAPVSDNK